MKSYLLPALTAAMLVLAPLTTEAAVSTVEQTLGRTAIARPVLEGLRDEAHQAVEQDLDRRVCELTEVVSKHEGASGALSYQLMSETDSYASLLLVTEWQDKKGRQEKRVQGVLYEKLHGRQVLLRDMLEGLPKPEQLEPLKERFGLLTPSGAVLAAADCGAIRRTPEDFVMDGEGRLYLLFQPGELTDKTAEPVLLLIAKA